MAYSNPQWADYSVKAGQPAFGFGMQVANVTKDDTM
jgi:hypothetical protein